MFKFITRPNYFSINLVICKFIQTHLNCENTYINVLSPYYYMSIAFGYAFNYLSPFSIIYFGKGSFSIVLNSSQLVSQNVNGSSIRPAVRET